MLSAHYIKFNADRKKKSVKLHICIVCIVTANRKISFQTLPDAVCANPTANRKISFQTLPDAVCANPTANRKISFKHFQMQFVLTPQQLAPGPLIVIIFNLSFITNEIKTKIIMAYRQGSLKYFISNS